MLNRKQETKENGYAELAISLTNSN